MVRSGRRLAAVSVIAALLATVAATPVLARPPVGTCPAGFGIGPMTLEAAIEYKVGTAGMPEAAVPFFTAYFASVDKNGNGEICMRELPDTPGIPAWVSQLKDDNAASGRRDG